MFVWTSCSVTSEAAPGLGMDHVGNDTEPVIVSKKLQKKATVSIFVKPRITRMTLIRKTAEQCSAVDL